ncbi:MAG: Clp protease N-terminal domain-containing protein, partial [Candidatus Kapaibacterium sp.]
MNIQKLTLKSQEAVQKSNDIARGYDNQSIEPLHLLAALVQDSQGIVPGILQTIGANLSYVKVKINDELEKLPKVAGAQSGSYVSAGMSALLEQAFREASALKDEYVSVEHLLLSL